jgi:hypothetical protein
MLPPSQRPAACRRCDGAPQHVDAGDFVRKWAPRRNCCGPGDSSTRADMHFVRLRPVVDVRRAAAENCGSAPEDARRTSCQQCQCCLWSGCCWQHLQQAVRRSHVPSLCCPWGGAIPPSRCFTGGAAGASSVWWSLFSHVSLGCSLTLLGCEQQW